MLSIKQRNNAFISFLILRETQVNLSLFKYLHLLVHMGSHKKIHLVVLFYNDAKQIIINIV